MAGIMKNGKPYGGTVTDDHIKSVVSEDLDKKVDKTSIVTSVSSTSTDNEVASAKAVFKRDVFGYSTHLNGDGVDKQLSDLGITKDLTIEEIFAKILEVYTNFEITISTNSHLSNFSSSLPVTTGGIVKIISAWNRCQIEFYDYRSENKYFKSNVDGTWSNWTKVCKSTEIQDFHIKTYTSLGQLGLTAPATVSEIFLTMKNGSYLELNNAVDSTTVYVSDVPDAFGILTIRKIDTGRFDIQFKKSAYGACSENYLYIGQLKGSDGTGLTWSRVCTTKVADTEGEGTQYSAITDYTCTNLKYTVSNGMCTIPNIYLTCNVSHGSSYAIANGFPIPVLPTDVIRYYFPLFSSEGILMLGAIDQNGQLVVAGGTNGKPYIGSVTYKVSES